MTLPSAKSLWRRILDVLRSVAIAPRTTRQLGIAPGELASRCEELADARAQLPIEIGERGRVEDERSDLRAQRPHAQRTDDLGQLAAGLAHDFNNLLVVIGLQCDLAQTAPDEARRNEALEQIRKATDRASDLAHQLLAFSRHQEVEPKVVDVDQIGSGTGRRGTQHPTTRNPADLRGDESVLLVENEVSVRRVLSASLEACGYEVWTAESSDEALELADRHSESLDALVSDVVMPGMDGIELSRKIRAQVPSLAIVLISGHTDRDVSDRPDGAAFLRKPFTFAELAGSLRDALDER